MRHFNKEWNWSKYHKKQDWEHITRVIRDRQRQGKKTEVLISGQLQSDQKIRKETARFGPFNAQTISARRPFFPTVMLKTDWLEASITEIPPGITIRTPTLDMTASWTYSLPFYEFENNLRLIYDPISLPSPPRGYIVEDQAADGDLSEGFTPSQNILTSEGQLGGDFKDTTHAVANTWTPDISVLTALKSVVPQPTVGGSLPGFPLNDLDIRVFTSPVHRQILCSVANNFPGLDGLAIQDIIGFLQKESNEKLYRTVQSAQGYTARAIIQSIFKAAVEAGDARAVDVLVRENPANIKINEQSCVVQGKRYTPIERATMLRHEKLVEIFLNHGAEVNRTYTEDAVGALDLAAAESFRTHWNAGPSQPRVFRKLLGKGGELCQSAIKSLIRKDSELAVLYISVQARKNAAQLCRWGVFCEAIEFMDHQLSMKIIEIMLECRVDLNHDDDESKGRNHHGCSGHHGNLYHHVYPCRVMDIAAQLGQLPVVDLLLRSGASLTGNTLPCAVKSQNKDLIRLLLESGADINSIGSLHITTLSVALGLRDDRMIRFLEDQGASIINQSKEHCSAAVLAALEAGNMQFLERLIQLGVKVSPEDLGYGLLIATMNDRDEDVKKLIDAGAYVDYTKCTCRLNIKDPGFGPPLYEVLKRRKESLTFSLLEAHANPNRSPSSIQLAVEWGNRSVIEALILAGVDFNGYGTSDAALAIAATRRDFGLIELLLNSGAVINSTTENTEASNPSKAETPLEVAAEMGDIDMAHYLIGQGADPNNSRALEKSFLKNQELFDLLCKTYRTRYPSARGGFGTGVLMHAIENGDHNNIRRILQNGINPEAIWVPTFSPWHDVISPYLHEDDYDLRLTAFGYAIYREKEDTTEYLLRYGCDPNRIVLQRVHERSKEPALLAAIGTQRISMVQLLINHKAKVNFLTFGPVKRTPLQKAAELGGIEIVTFLINHGADVNAPAAFNAGGTSLQLAAIGGYIPVACKLLNHKADVNAPGAKVHGRTALEGAAEHGRLDMVKLLLNAGADSRRGVEGQVANAIALARENEFIYICDLLESHFHGGQGQDSGPEMLLGGSYDDPGEWNLDEDPFPF